METSTVSKTEGIERELAMPQHDTASLNGQSENAKKVVRTQPFKDEDELVTYFAGLNKGKYGQLYHGLKDESHRKVLRHTQDEKIFVYFDTKSESGRQSIIDEVHEVLWSIDEKREEEKNFIGKKEEVSKLITSTDAVIKKLPKANAIVVGEIRTTLTSLQDELDSPHRKLETINLLITNVSTKTASLIEGEKIAEVKSYATFVQEQLQKTADNENESEDVREWSLHTAKTIGQRIENDSDILLLGEDAELIHKELADKINPVVRSQTQAVAAEVQNMARIALCILFKTEAEIEDKKYASVLKTIDAHTVKTHPQYVARLGKIAKANKDADDLLEMFCRAWKGVLMITTEEWIIIGSGGKSVEGAMGAIPAEIQSAPNLDKELTLFQSSVLGLTEQEVSDPAKHFNASAAKVIDIKKEITLILSENSGFTDSQSKNVVNGPLFVQALRSLPTLIMDSFIAGNKKNKEESSEISS